jgi:hypothetical protein
MPSVLLQYVVLVGSLACSTMCSLPDFELLNPLWSEREVTVKLAGLDGRVGLVSMDSQGFAWQSGSSICIGDPSDILTMDLYG